MDARQHIIHEAIEEQRQIFGAENPDRQWILSSWDTWERNPFYHGPEQPHPEDDDGREMLPDPPVEIHLPKTWAGAIAAHHAKEIDDCPF